MMNEQNEFILIYFICDLNSNEIFSKICLYFCNLQQNFTGLAPGNILSLQIEETRNTTNKITWINRKHET